MLTLINITIIFFLVFCLYIDTPFIRVTIIAAIILNYKYPFVLKTISSIEASSTVNYQLKDGKCTGPYEYMNISREKYCFIMDNNNLKSLKLPKNGTMTLTGGFKQDIKNITVPLFISDEDFVLRIKAVHQN